MQVWVESRLLMIICCLGSFFSVVALETSMDIRFVCIMIMIPFFMFNFGFGGGLFFLPDRVGIAFAAPSTLGGIFYLSLVSYFARWIICELASFCYDLSESIHGFTSVLPILVSSISLGGRAH